MIEITVPYQDRALELPAPERVRRLRRHLVDALRDLRVAKRAEPLVQPRTANPPDAVAAVLRAGCAACRGQCCTGGGEHAYLDERTMARVRQAHPEWDARSVIAAYVHDVAPLSFAGSCLFHGSAGCTLDRSLRAELCASYYCDALQSFLADPATPGTATIRYRPLQSKS